MRRATVTLNDVAVASGVSASTASRVLNGGKPVSAELEARVREAAARIGYVSNTAASAMRGRKGLLAILTDELGVEALAELSIAAGKAATTAGLTTTVSSAGTEPEQQLLALRVLRSLRPRAIVITGGWLSDPAIRATLEHELDDFVKDGGNVVVMGPAVLPHPTVSFDDFGDGVLIAQHMTAAGGESALVLAGPDSSMSNQARSMGIVAGLRESGVERIQILNSRNESDDVERVVTAHATDAKPDMVLCVNDRLALGAYAAFDGLGLHLPRDVTLSGIDDLPISRNLTPSLTTVAHPLEAVGAHVVELALQGASAEYRRTFPGTLIVRDSSRLGLQR